MFSTANLLPNNISTLSHIETQTYKNVTHYIPPDVEFQIPNTTFENSNASMEIPFGNYTEYAEIPYYIKATSMTFCIVIMCLGVIGNVMVPIVILKTKDMRNSTNIFLVNLSIADLMVLLVCTPTVLVEVNSKPETWLLGKELCLAVPFVELTVAHASVLTILAISFERYYAICEPLRAGYVCTKTRATLICALAWFFAALFTSPILAIAEHRTLDLSGTHQCLTQVATFWQIFFFIMVIIILYIIPLIILIILYSVIAKNLINAASKVVMNKTVDPYNTRARKQVILMLGTVVLCFFLCLMPYRVLALWIIISPAESLEEINPEKWYNLLYFSRIMLYINSAINPILYNLMSSKFRIGFCKVCICYKNSVAVKNRRVLRKRTGTLTTGSTTSSSLTRTTNSLKKLFNRSSLERSAMTKSSDINSGNSIDHHSNNTSNGFFGRFSKRRFIRQQSAPVYSNPKVTKLNRMLSENSVVNKKKETDEFRDIEGHSSNKDMIDGDFKDRSDSLRRSALINSVAKSVDRDANCEKTECIVAYRNAKSLEKDLPESFV